MNRRTFVGLLPGAVALARTTPEFSRFAVVTDEVARTPADAIAFAHQYGVGFLELRSVPGIRRHYFTLPEDELRQVRRDFDAAGLRVSFFNTPFFKYTLPGTEYTGRQETSEDRQRRVAREEQQFHNRDTELEKAMRAAEILGVDKIRVFAFRRTSEPEKMFPRVAEIISAQARRAARAGLRLLVENEGSCNVATSAHLTDFVKLVNEKNVGINWDPSNVPPQRERQFPDAYQRLPKDRLWNVQMKGKGLLDYPERLDWGAILRALDRDGYRYKIGLETHIGGSQNIEKSHACMRELSRLTGVA